VKILFTMLMMTDRFLA